MNTQIPVNRSKSTGASLNVHSIFHTIQGEGPFSGVPAVFLRLAGCNLQCPGCDTEYTDRAEDMTVATILSNINFKLKGNTTTLLIVISGGEPFRQNITPIIDLLQQQGYEVQIETNGSMAPQEDIPSDTIVICSPKTSKLNPKILPYITAYKYVVNHQQVLPLDGLPITALEHRATPFVARPHEGFEGDIYVSPMDMDAYYEEMSNRLFDGYLLDTKADKAFSRANDDEKDRLTAYYRAKANRECHVHNLENIQSCVESSMKFGYTLQLQIHKLVNME